MGIPLTKGRIGKRASKYPAAPTFTARGVPSMCDYSLHHVATRPAQIEDKLVTTKFSNSITRGFAAVGEPHVAVCLLPGTEIAFDNNVEYEPSFGIGLLPNKKIGQRLARFRQINTNYCRGPSRCVGISRRTGGTAHAADRGPARDGVAIAGRRTSSRHEGGDEASGERAFAFGLNTVRGPRSRAIGDTVALLSIGLRAFVFERPESSGGELLSPR